MRQHKIWSTRKSVWTEDWVVEVCSNRRDQRLNRNTKTEQSLKIQTGIWAETLIEDQLWKSIKEAFADLKMNNWAGLLMTAKNFRFKRRLTGSPSWSGEAWAMNHRWDLVWAQREDLLQNQAISRLLAAETVSDPQDEHLALSSARQKHVFFFIEI